jgi:hypothetical protein
MCVKVSHSLDTVTNGNNGFFIHHKHLKLTPVLWIRIHCGRLDPIAWEDKNEPQKWTKKKGLIERWWGGGGGEAASTVDE